MIHVVAVITAKPGQREALLAAVRENLPAVLAEEGCIEYGPVVDAQAHARAPHMAEYAAKTKDLVAARAIHILTAA
jgi:quinol monooxygenase YgiN